MSRVSTLNGRFAVYADCDFFNRPIDVFASLKKKDLVIEGGAIQVTASSEVNAVTATLDWMKWLPFCAKEYAISRNPEDYVLMPTIICPSDIPNRNGVGFPLQELVKWDPETHRQVFRGWKGCPTYSEHDNNDCKRARGVVVDVTMRKVQGYQGNIYKVMGLAGFDRNKYPEVAHRLLTRQTRTVSMGALVSRYSCGLCHSPAGHCGHINLRRPRDFYMDAVTGKLVYRKCHGIRPFELSEVDTPAWFTAESPLVVDMSTQATIK